jgi:hypothetical protein
MQRTMAVTSLAMLLLAVFVWTTDTWARAGGGSRTFTLRINIADLSRGV